MDNLKVYMINNGGTMWQPVEMLDKISDKDFIKKVQHLDQFNEAQILSLKDFQQLINNEEAELNNIYLRFLP